jgi:uncharacterized protein (TIGR02646 family)
MRYINPNLIDPKSTALPADWLATAEKAKKEVNEENADIDKFSTVWRNFKPALESVIGKKCWYCEVVQSRSDKDVEHFRPKKAVASAKNHDGYKWLAFDYKNFRYSCQFCNRIREDKVNNRKGGKGNKFPLIEESKRAYSPGGEVYEKPKLLDPCIEADVNLLDFNDDGTPCPVPSAKEVERERVVVSIRLYHLDHSEIVEERKALAHKLEDCINDAEYYFKKSANGEKEAVDLFIKKVNTLKKAIDIREEFSLFAERYIAGKRDLDWIEFVLE